MIKGHFRRWMITYLLILILIELGIIKIWLIKDIPLVKTRARNVERVAREIEKFRREDGLVTLLPPYTEWKWNKHDPLARLSVSGAVRAVCLQARPVRSSSTCRRVRACRRPQRAAARRVAMAAAGC